MGTAQGIVSRFAGSAVARLSGAAAAFLSVGRTIQYVIDATREELIAENKLNAVLKATGFAAGKTADEIASFAAHRQDVTNFGDEATVAGAAILATFREIKGPVFDEALAAAQDLSTVMGQDLQSSVVQIGKALNDPIAGVTALRRVGVSFTQDQIKQIKVLGETNDLLGQQRIILDELRKEFSGAAKALVSPWEQLKNVLSDIAEIVGKKTKPATDSFLESLNTDLQRVRAGLPLTIDAIKQFFESDFEKVNRLRKDSGLPDPGFGVGEQLAKLDKAAGRKTQIELIAEQEQRAKDEADALNDMFKDMSSTLEGLKTPAEKLFEEFDKIDSLFSVGAVSQELFDRATERLLTGLKEISDIKLEKQFGKAEQAAASFFESTRTPLEKLYQQLDDAQMLVAEGLLPEDVVPRILADIGEEIKKTTEKGKSKPVEGVAALQRGSSEAFSAVQAAIRLGNNQPINQVATNTKESAITLKEVAKSAQSIWENLRDNPGSLIGL